MRHLLDASALVAIIRNEAEGPELISSLEQSEARLTNGVAVWETARALARDHLDGLAGGLAETKRYLTSFNIEIIGIGAAEAVQAVHAQQRYGKGSGHPARLNMGDCFAYACATTNNARLLYKGDDFVHTDLA